VTAEHSCATKCPPSTPTVTSHDTVEENGLDISDPVIHTPCAITPTPEDMSNGTHLVPPEGNPAHPLHVRFRPRVRITSGLNRHRHQQGWLTVGDQQDSSSRPGSASSSVSAPLRTRIDDEVGKPGWGTLGQRVSLLAKRRKSMQEIRENELNAKIHKHGAFSVVNHGTDERTPLLNSYLLYYDEDDGSSLSKLVDRVFGPWPVRLLNHHVSPIYADYMPY
jgi:hypothetical protein